MAESRTVRNGECSGSMRGRSARILARQVLDARRSRDCLEDLPVYFDAEENNDIRSRIEGCTSVRGERARVEKVDFAVQSAPLNDGCYIVDCAFTFELELQFYLPGSVLPLRAIGRAYHQKRCLLFGGCAGVQTFSSDGTATGELPIATVQVGEPVILQAFVTEPPPCGRPASTDSPPPDSAEAVQQARSVFATIGVFSVISLERDAQLIVPVLRFGAPPRECVAGDFSEDPCQLFRRAAFPAEIFCP